jgi:lipoate-protein ligase A
MIYIEPKSTDCAFHFSAEEYVMEMMKPKEPVLMLWRTERTVMIGANQIAEAEADLAYAKERGVAVVRRSSGGGAIYTDPGVLLYTIILPFTDSTDTKTVISDYLAGPATEALRRMGISASLEGRNDIIVGDKKISGIAQYIRHGYLCSHGSLLFDADLTELSRVLTADDEKIAAKALRSVRSRVTNIAEHLPEEKRAGGIGNGALTDVLTFMKGLRERWDAEFGLTEYHLSAEDIAAIEDIRMKKYASWKWTFGHAPRYSYRNSKRFPGGGVEVFAEVKGGVIERIKMAGDFLALRPLSDIEDKLEGVPFQSEAIDAAISERDVRTALGSVTKAELMSVFS